MRVIKALVALCFVAVGLVFGALNRQRVTVELGLASALSAQRSNGLGAMIQRIRRDAELVASG